MGKGKIEIKKIENRQQRSVTFTKRRDGLFKKAETACQKFGLQIGIVVFSPAGKPFTFCNSSSSLSVDAIIDTYISSSLPSSSSVVGVGNKRSRSDGDDDDDVQVIETEKKKKQKTMMNDAVVTPPPPPPCITIQDEEEKLGFHSDQELRNEFMGSGDNAGIVTGEMTMMMESSSQFLVEGESHSTWVPDVELQEIVNLDDFEFDHHHDHCDDKIMGLLPTPQTTTSTSLCDDSMLASDMNVEEVGVATNEDDGYTLEEWEQIFSTSPTSVVVGNSYMNQQVPVDDCPTLQEFLQFLCSEFST